jgi:hypothetical protein
MKFLVLLLSFKAFASLEIDTEPMQAEIRNGAKATQQRFEDPTRLTQLKSARVIADVVIIREEVLKMVRLPNTPGSGAVYRDSVVGDLVGNGVKIIFSRTRDALKENPTQKEIPLDDNTIFNIEDSESLRVVGNSMGQRQYSLYTRNQDDSVQCELKILMHDGYVSTSSLLGGTNINATATYEPGFDTIRFAGQSGMITGTCMNSSIQVATYYFPFVRIGNGEHYSGLQQLR